MKTYRVLKVLAGLGGITVFGYNSVPHLIPRKIIEPLCSVPGQSPSLRHKQLLTEVCEEMNIDATSIHLFYNNGFSSLSGGCTSLPGKCVLGLSRNTLYTSVEDVRAAAISFKNKTVEYDSELGKVFETNLIFTDRQIKFLLAHELGHIKNIHFVYRTIHATCFYVSTLSIVILSALILKRAFPYQILTTVIGYSGYKQTQKKLNHWIEFNADESAAMLGLEYCTGGIEYLEQKLKLNCVMRKVNGTNGEVQFSLEGNNLQSSHPKETMRLEKIREFKQAFSD